MKIVSLLKLCALVPGVLSSCNPLKSRSCDADQALGTSFKEDFKSESPYFDTVNPKGVSYGDDGLELKLAKRFDNPTLKSKFYIMFGKVEVTMQAAEGKGIISSFFLQSDDLDEIDIELFGGDDYEFQLNFFSKGDTTTYDRGEYHPTSSNPLQNFHTYTLDWNKDSLSWLLDGKVVRTLDSNNPQGYPQSPMYIRMGIWAGGDPSNEPGTIKWAGGSTDYSEMPFAMYVKSLIVTDYSTGEKYEYSNQSGDWTSIKAVDGEVNGREKQADKDFETLQGGASVDTKFVAFNSASSAASSSKSPSFSSSKLLSSSSSKPSRSSPKPSSSSSPKSSPSSSIPSSSSSSIPSSSSSSIPSSSSSSIPSSSSSSIPSSSSSSKLASSLSSKLSYTSTSPSSTSDNESLSSIAPSTASNAVGAVPSNYSSGASESGSFSTTEASASSSMALEATTIENNGNIVTTSLTTIIASIFSFILI